MRGADGYLIALDMSDGSLLWSQPVASAAGGQYFSMPPLIYGDLIIAGPSGADFGAKNWVGARRSWRASPRPPSGVLFTGDLNNDFLALDAATGDVSTASTPAAASAAA